MVEHKSHGSCGEIADGETVYKFGSVDFDYDAIDRGNPLVAVLEDAPEDKVKTLAVAFDRILRWCWKTQTDRCRQNRAAFFRFAALTAAMRPDLMGNVSYAKLGKECGVTKSLLSKLAVEFQDEFGVHFRRSMKVGAVESRWGKKK
jgi:hypothetical protein